MRVVRWALLLCLLFVIAGCGGSKPQDLIIGNWDAKENLAGKDITVKTEFTKDGKIRLSVEGFPPQEGTYKFIDDNTIDLEVGQAKKKVKIESISKEKMVLVEPEGKKQEFTRAK
jgi:hypothetical protein